MPTDLVVPRPGAALSAQAQPLALVSVVADVSLPRPAMPEAVLSERLDRAALSAQAQPRAVSPPLRRELDGLSATLSASPISQRGVRLSAFYDNAQTFPGSLAPSLPVPSAGSVRRWWSRLLSRLGWKRAKDKASLEALRQERMRYFLSAKSIAVVGATPKPGKVGNAILNNLLATFKGSLYPINERLASQGSTEMGLKWHRSLLDIPPAELVVIAVPAKSVQKVMEDVAKGGHQSVIIISAGLAESGKKEEEREIMALAARHGVPVIGMNSMGVAKHDQNASFGPAPLRGEVAFLSQSGALIAATLDRVRAQGLGFSAVFSMGNKTNVDEAELIRLMGDDPGTRAIIGYVEDVKDGQKFIDAVREVSKKKPIVLLRTGRTRLGEVASAAHTAALGGGSYGLFAAACEEAGAYLVDSLRAFFELAKKLQTGQPLASFPPGRPQAKDSKEAGNPAVDVIGDALADRYQATIRILQEAQEVEAILVVLTPQTVTEVEKTAQVIIAASKASDKPIVPVFFGGTRMKQALELFAQAGIAAFGHPDRLETGYPEDALDYLRSKGILKNIGIITNAGGIGVQMTDYAVETSLALVPYKPDTVKRLKEVLPPASNVHSFGEAKPPAPKPRTLTLDEAQATRILMQGGLRYPQTAVGKDLSELVLKAKQLNYGGGKGLVLKAISPDIDHMRKAGGIAEKDGKIWFIKSEAELKAAFAIVEENMRRLREKAPAVRITGYLLSQVVEGQEMIVGLERSEIFGLVLTLGAGGSDVAEKNDAVKTIFTDAMSREERLQILRERIRKLRMVPQLVAAGVDIEAILGTAMQVYEVGARDARIKTIDVNPIKVDVDPSGKTTVAAVDAWIELIP